MKLLHGSPNPKADINRIDKFACNALEQWQRRCEVDMTIIQQFCIGEPEELS